MKEIFYQDNEDLRMVHLQNIAYSADKIYRFKPLKILDLATGGNGFNSSVIRALVDWNIDYEFVLSDISPTWMIKGYEKLEKELAPQELKKVKCVLADSTDLRKDLTLIPLWDEQITKPLENILDDPKYYSFLRTGYNFGKRNEDFSDKTFDMVIGCGPYGSINKGDYRDAIKESARILKIGGYHVIYEMHVEEINPNIERTESALRRAKIKDIDIIKSRLDAIMEPVGWYSATYPYMTEERNPEQSMQYGDMVKRSVLVHKKVEKNIL
jgi:hypothetical protein